MKSFIYHLFHFSLEIVMKVPFHCIRNIYINRFIQKRGKRVEICRNVELRYPKNIYIGNYCTVNKRVLLDGRGGTIRIGDCVDIAQDTKIWTLQHDYNSPTYEAVGKSVILEDYVWIASNVTILPGIRVGEGAVVATGAVVTRDVPPYTIVAGIPAKKIGERKRELNYKLGQQRWFE